MNDHHLILGHLRDVITGQVLDDTHDERYRQKIARLLVAAKGYARAQIRTGERVMVTAGTKCAQVPVTFLVIVAGRAAMLIQYGPGSLVTRHRPALALAKLAAPHQIPVVVVTNGEDADILDGINGRVTASGLERIPSREQLAAMLQHHRWTAVSEQHAGMAARIVMAFEVDDRCPCDDTVCSWNNLHKAGL